MVGTPKSYNSRHLRLPEHLQSENSLPLSTAGNPSHFRIGSGEGLLEPGMELPAALSVFLIYGVLNIYRVNLGAICRKVGYRTDVPAGTPYQGGYWGIAEIVSQYRAIWGPSDFSLFLDLFLFFFFFLSLSIFLSFSLYLSLSISHSLYLSFFSLFSGESDRPLTPILVKSTTIHLPFLSRCYRGREFAFSIIVNRRLP